ncbi:uncharacterized protein LOC135202106 [Macrobrachium nipponense]|uniref:uncharacterized protein LOC135202106 n=1 Tax=Macrobrachium nipponense TaxID=159736 RepID=UPI0030C7B162
MIRARIFLQDLRKQQLKWDDLLSVPLLEQWNELSKEKSLSISFSRSTNLEKADYLHIFCDASITAYGCVAYRASGKTSSLIIAKGRVAPIKELTVPKLELMALLLGARLCEFIVETFEENKFEKIIVWSESKVALGWLVTKNNLPVFVKNRVMEINSITAGIVFSYVPSSENPSDWITRGKRTDKVRNNSFWWEGPPWLKSENHTYPIDRTWVKEAQTQDEVIQVHLVGNSEKTHLLTWERFSRVDKFCKTIAWIMQFIHNCKSTGRRKIGSLTLEELQQAKNKMIILLQKEYFPEEYKALEKGDKVSKLTLLA